MKYFFARVETLKNAKLLVSKHACTAQSMYCIVLHISNKKVVEIELKVKYFVKHNGKQLADNAIEQYDIERSTSFFISR